LAIDIRQADAEDLPFEDGTFDYALSLIGSMFAPRPERVASEMVRVVRTGGTVAMGNWTPAGHVGQMFKVIGKHVPPPSIFPSPLLWGDPDTVRERFGDLVQDLTIRTYLYPFRYPFGPAEVVDFFIQFYGPTLKAYGSLDDAGKAALRSDLIELWSTNNRADDGATHVESEYIEVLAKKRQPLCEMVPASARRRGFEAVHASNHQGPNGRTEATPPTKTAPNGQRNASQTRARAAT
jgi:SAM-dependent methyltransferase